MSKRDDLAPFERHQARKWTRISDYLPEAEVQVLLPPPARRRGPPRPPQERVSRRGLWLPVYLLGLLAAALWMSGALDRPASQSAAPSPEPATAGATSAEGVVFGLCHQGGGTNCVVDGDSFFLAGKSMRIAGIDAPKPHAPACPAEAALGRAATLRLHALLNSGTVTMTPVARERDPNGRLLRQVRVGGNDVAATMVDEGFARREGAAKGWC